MPDARDLSIVRDALEHNEWPSRAMQQLYGLAFSDKGACLTEEQVRVDKAVARAEAMEQRAALLEYELARVSRRSSGLEAKVAQLSELVARYVESDRESSDSGIDADFRDDILERTRLSVATQLGERFADISAEISADPTIGRVVDLTVYARSDRQEFRVVREQVIRAYEAATSDVDTTGVVLHVTRCDRE